MSYLNKSCDFLQEKRRFWRRKARAIEMECCTTKEDYGQCTRLVDRWLNGLILYLTLIPRFCQCNFIKYVSFSYLLYSHFKTQAKVQKERECGEWGKVFVKMYYMESCNLTFLLSSNEFIIQFYTFKQKKHFRRSQRFFLVQDIAILSHLWFFCS